jgi:hypothetical protein
MLFCISFMQSIITYLIKNLLLQCRIAVLKHRDTVRLMNTLLLIIMFVFYFTQHIDTLHTLNKDFRSSSNIGAIT